jgi:hypothetical protein
MHLCVCVTCVCVCVYVCVCVRVCVYVIEGQSGRESDCRTIRHRFDPAQRARGDTRRGNLIAKNCFCHQDYAIAKDHFCYQVYVL